MSTSPDGIYEPGIIDPGLPVANSTQPFWFSEPAKIASLQSPWLDAADVVIVGSGMTSVSLSRALLSKRPDLRVVVVEARNLCSGATGRNGGHIKVMSPGVWFDRKKQYGVEEAIRVMEYEHSHLAEMSAVIRENKINCDLRLLEGLDVYHDEAIFRRAVRALDDMRKYSPKLASRYSVYTAREDLRARKCTDRAIAAIGMPSATAWPYKMVTGLFEILVRDKGLSIQTNTTVTSVLDNDYEDWAIVKTSRGDIRARHVVHATNGWIGHLVPELRPFVSPVRANVQRQLSPASLRVDNSFWLRYGEKDYDYMIQRPDGAFIIGRSNMGRRATADDSKTDLLPHVHLRGSTPQVFDFESDQISVTHAWSGVVAFTQDANPFVGRLPFPNRTHQWVCAAYQGIGMVRAFRTAQMLALMILDEEVPEQYPRSMLISEDRLKSLHRMISGTSKL
jgi:glycine/D-amino acid oxidase-like deaminating enzyme